MAYYLRNAVKEVDENGNYCFRRTPEQLAEAKRLYGDIPEGDIFDMSYFKVRKWGNPWWRIYDIIYDRNARKDSLTDADDFLAWKALLFVLSTLLSEYSLPKRMVGYTTPRQWRSDMFADGAASLWKLIHDARGKRLKVKEIAWIALTRAARDSRTHKVPENFDMDRFAYEWRNDHFVVDPAREAMYIVDNETRELEAEMFVHSVVDTRAKVATAPEAKAFFESFYRKVSDEDFRRRYQETY